MEVQVPPPPNAFAATHGYLPSLPSAPEFQGDAIPPAPQLLSANVAGIANLVAGQLAQQLVDRRPFGSESPAKRAKLASTSSPSCASSATSSTGSNPSANNGNPGNEPKDTVNGNEATEATLNALAVNAEGVLPLPNPISVPSNSSSISGASSGSPSLTGSGAVKLKVASEDGHNLVSLGRKSRKCAVCWHLHKKKSRCDNMCEGCQVMMHVHCYAREHNVFVYAKRWGFPHKKEG